MREPPITSESQWAKRYVRLSATTAAMITAVIIHRSRRRPVVSAMTMPMAVTADAIAWPEG